MTSNRLTLHIEPRADGERIAGRLRDGCGEVHQFTGWLGLLTLLEQARREAAAGRPDAPECPGEPTEARL